MTIISITACCILAVGAAGWYYGIAEAALVCCIFAAFGALWFGKGRAKLVDTLGLIIKQLREKRPIRIKRASAQILNELSQTINSRIEIVDKLEEQLKELHLRLEEEE